MKKDGPLSNAVVEGWGSAAEDGQQPVGTLAHCRVWTFNDVGANLGEYTLGLGSGRRDGGNERKIPSPGFCEWKHRTHPTRLSAPGGAAHLVWFSLDTRLFSITLR